jgi:hypothetical protein
MKNKKETIRIAVAMTLALALVLTGLPESFGGIGQASHSGAHIAYAATTGGAVTGGAVTAPVDISTALIAPIKDLNYSGKKKKPSPKVTLDGKALKKKQGFHRQLQE